MLHVARVRIVRHLVRRGELGDDADPGVQGDLAEREPAMAQLAAAAVSGLPPAGPELRRRLEPVLLRGLGDARIRGPLSVEEGGFSLHAATAQEARTPQAARLSCAMCFARPGHLRSELEVGPGKEPSKRAPVQKIAAAGSAPAVSQGRLESNGILRDALSKRDGTSE